MNTVPPKPRPGPRPLPIHLTAASGYYTSLIAASLALKNGSIAWNPGLAKDASALTADLTERLQKRAAQSARQPDAANRQNDFTLAVELEARRRLGRMLDGIQAYRAHPYHRQVPDPDVLWQEGTTRLLDYRPFRAGRSTRRPVVLIPSLVNRAHILDLREERSLARWLAARGHSVFLVDWDSPGAVERDFTLSHYVARLQRALVVAAEHAGTSTAAIGYCMGGLLALAAAQGAEDHVDALVLMATPWDFHADRPDQARGLAALMPVMEPTLSVLGEMPLDMLQTLFAALDPTLALRKFAAFAAMDPCDENATAFVALEDWLNDGVALAAPVARECITHWYGRNTPGKGQWRVDGRPVLPDNWRKPALSIIPAADRIVPPASASALAHALPRGMAITPRAGHIGMVTARSAPDRVWRPLAEFLDDPDAPAKA
ncbi:MAG: alpha/beta fold hydrolase [Alphaproteobacteria bacterium]|nr:alpha/beta fold hydrolase [Alphaproteobacteria bacterium]